MADYRLEPLTDETVPLWDDVADRSPHGNLFYSRRWRAIADGTAGEARHDFLLFRDAEVIGLFPFVPSALGPFRGLEPARDPERLPALLTDDDPLALARAVRCLRRTRVDGRSLAFAAVSSLSDNAFAPLGRESAVPWADDGDMVLDLVASPLAAVWETLTPNRRKKIRRFEKDGFTVTEVRSRADLQPFYQYYFRNLVAIGARPLPISRFLAIWDAMGDTVRISLLARDSLVAGGLLQFLDDAHATVHGTYVSLNRDLPNTYSPSYCIWWEAATWAHEHGYARFSFGAQHRDAANPRYQVKYCLGGRFVPWHTRLVPLTPVVALWLRGAQYLAHRRVERAAPASAPRAARLTRAHLDRGPL